MKRTLSTAVATVRPTCTTAQSTPANTRHSVRNTLVLAAAALLFATANAQTANPNIQTVNSNAQSVNAKGLYDNLPFAMNRVAEPDIPIYNICITDFGGVPDGKTPNTLSFAKAIKHLEERGGGRLNVPFGVWLTGPIELKSRIELHLEDGALVLFSPDRADYPLVESTFEGVKSRRCMSPLTANGATDVAITGNGVFNGSGESWRPVKRSKLTPGQWAKLCEGGALNKAQNVWYPTAGIRDISNDNRLIAEAFGKGDDASWNRIHDYLRPALLSFTDCKRVLLEGATFENSPGWNLHPLMCEDLTLRNVTIRNPWFAQNGDGLDLESCRNVVVCGCSLDVGDDAICIKSGRDKEGRDRNKPTENVIIDGCRVYHGHGGFVIGSEMSGGARNILLRKCLFIGTDAGLRFKSTRGRGGTVSDIYIEDIGMSGIKGDAVTFNLYYGGANAGNNTAEKVEADETTPSFRDITIKNVVCKGAKQAAYFNGLPEMPIRNITVSNSVFESESGFTLNHIHGLTLDNVQIDNAKGETIVRQNGVEGFKRR